MLYIFLEKQLPSYQDYCLIFSGQLETKIRQEVLKSFGLKEVYSLTTPEYYYETNLLYKIIDFITNPSNCKTAFFINCFEGSYKVTVVANKKTNA